MSLPSVIRISGKKNRPFSYFCTYKNAVYGIKNCVYGIKMSLCIRRLIERKREERDVTEEGKITQKQNLQTKNLSSAFW